MVFDMNKRIIIISTLFLAIDQILKLVAELNNVHISVIKNFFNLTYVQNTGAAWSILQGKTALLIIISIVMLVLIYSMTFSFSNTKFNDFAFGLLFSGVFGNLIDRVFCGYVRDFLDFEIFGYNFPVFNIADMAIIIGVILLMVASIKGEKENGNSSKSRRKLRKN